MSNRQKVKKQLVTSPEQKRRGHCHIYTCTTSHVLPHCQQALNQLNRMGYHTITKAATFDMGIDVLREGAVQDALDRGAEHVMFIDPTMQFHPQAVDKMLADDHDVLSGVWPDRNHRPQVSFVDKEEGEEFMQNPHMKARALFVACGFMLVKRGVFEAIKKTLSVGEAKNAMGQTVTPWFMPECVPHDEGFSQRLTGDQAFCARVRGAGFEIIVDADIDVINWDLYPFTHANLRREQRDRIKSERMGGETKEISGDEAQAS